MRIAILTSVDTRHRYFVNALRARCDVVAVGYEETGYHPAYVPADDLSAADRAVVHDHFEERSRQEKLFFGHDDALVHDQASCTIRTLAPRTLNTYETLEWLEKSAADTVVVYGTNLIKLPLLGRWPGRMINMHLGLSPYYRGTATNFYPLVNGEPQYVGATIHLIDAGIDSGPIFAHARPRITADDRPHTLGCKAILAGIDALLSVLERLSRGAIEPVPQWPVPHARLYLRKDYHPRQVLELYRRLDEGMIAQYVARADKGPAVPQLIECPRTPREPIVRVPVVAGR